MAKIDSERITARMQRSELETEVDDREMVIDIALDFMSNVSNYWQIAPLELQRRFQNLVELLMNSEKVLEPPKWALHMR